MKPSAIQEGKVVQPFGYYGVPQAERYVGHACSFRVQSVLVNARDPLTWWADNKTISGCSVRCHSPPHDSCHLCHVRTAVFGSRPSPDQTTQQAGTWPSGHAGVPLQEYVDGRMDRQTDGFGIAILDWSVYFGITLYVLVLMFYFYFSMFYCPLKCFFVLCICISCCISYLSSSFFNSYALFCVQWPLAMLHYCIKWTDGWIGQLTCDTDAIF